MTLQAMTRAVRPRKVFLAFDGPAPLAKLLTQRKRRHRVLSVRQASSAISSSHFTPGTKLMHDAKAALNYLATSHTLSNVDVVFVSGSDREGEGEFKIYDYINHHMPQSPPIPLNASSSSSNNNNNSNNNNTSSTVKRPHQKNQQPSSIISKHQPTVSHPCNVILGNDSDLILFSLLQTNPNPVYLLKQATRNEYSCFDVRAFSEQLQRDLRLPAGSFEVDLVFLTLLSGSDYLPRLRGFNFSSVWKRYMSLRPSKYHDQPLVSCTATDSDFSISIHTAFLRDLIPPVHVHMSQHRSLSLPESITTTITTAASSTTTTGGSGAAAAAATSASVSIAETALINLAHNLLYRVENSGYHPKSAFYELLARLNRRATDEISSTIDPSDHARLVFQLSIGSELLPATDGPRKAVAESRAYMMAFKRLVSGWMPDSWRASPFLPRLPPDPSSATKRRQSRASNIKQSTTTTTTTTTTISTTISTTAASIVAADVVGATNVSDIIDQHRRHVTGSNANATTTTTTTAAAAATHDTEASSYDTDQDPDETLLALPEISQQLKAEQLKVSNLERSTKYLQGIAWAIYYLQARCADYSYHYPLLLAPTVNCLLDSLASLSDASTGRLTATVPLQSDTLPMKPLAFSLSLLPVSSQHTLPEAFHPLMHDQGPLTEVFHGSLRSNLVPWVTDLPRIRELIETEAQSFTSKLLTLHSNHPSKKQASQPTASQPTASQPTATSTDRSIHHFTNFQPSLVFSKQNSPPAPNYTHAPQLRWSADSVRPYCFIERGTHRELPSREIPTLNPFSPRRRDTATITSASQPTIIQQRTCSTTATRRLVASSVPILRRVMSLARCWW
mgnify:FL=1